MVTPAAAHPAPPARQRPRIPWKMATVAAGALLLLLWAGWARCGIGGCPDVDRLGAYQPDGAPLLVDRDGQELGHIQLADRSVVELESLPDAVPEAFLAVEDRRFWEHQGIDWRRVGGALVANVKAGGIEEGSSTITMQLARNLFPERLPGEQRTMKRKLLEMRVAREIEDQFDKPEILELYLNHIYFGGGARGIEAASQLYFGHSATYVSLAQAALLAALPKAPSRYDPRRHPERARERRNLVLDLMEEQGRIEPQQAAAARDARLGIRTDGSIPEQPVPFAPWVLEEIRERIEAEFGDSLYREPVRIVTTLDREVQQAAEEELVRQLRAIEGGAFGRFSGPRYGSGAEVAPEATPYLQGAVVVLEAATGDVLAWVGGRDWSHSTFDRARRAHRQVGSAFKPFVFAAALARGHPASERLSDQPVTVRVAAGEQWEPRNFEDDYDDSVTLRDALVRSKNAATVRLAREVGLSPALRLARQAGIAADVRPLPAVALGALPASPLALTAAYTAFANLGQAITPRLVRRVETIDGELLWEAPVTRREVLDPAVAYLVTDMLREAVDRGTARAVRQSGYGGPAAGKTGTTNEQHDAWFVGFTPDVVATVWIGFDRPRSIVPGASGGRLAGPPWARLMRRVDAERQQPGDWLRPADVVELPYEEATGRVFDRCDPPPGAPRELFLAKTLPPSACAG
ncbi:MAG TPA: PBP1A family penicillin-binding protein, partial [Thermoanaerobaculia bacterium]|nr:PBP1A family penicillin-binding protein [Thermoanaerobaculia bacterium]